MRQGLFDQRVFPPSHYYYITWRSKALGTFYATNLSLSEVDHWDYSHPTSFKGEVLSCGRCSACDVYFIMREAPYK